MSANQSIPRSTRHLVTIGCLAALLLAPVAIRDVHVAAQSPEFPAVGEPAIVTLVEPGAAPRRELRYRVSRDETMTMDMSMLMSMTMEMGGMVMPTTNMPLMLTAADLTMNDVAESGDMTYRITFTKAGVETADGVDPALLAAMQSMERALVGLTGTTTVSDRGVVRAVAFDLGGITDPQMEQAMAPMAAQMKQFSMPLPIEAVGVGAKWDVRHRLDLNGIETSQVGSYELTALDGDMVTLTVSVEQTAANQTIDNPDLPPGASMRLRRLTARGSGTIQLDLTSLVPTSEISTTSNAVMDIDMAGDSQSMGVETKLKVTVRGSRGVVRGAGSR